jgi:hypothetical protein
MQPVAETAINSVPKAFNKSLKAKTSPQPWQALWPEASMSGPLGKFLAVTFS